MSKNSKKNSKKNSLAVCDQNRFGNINIGFGDLEREVGSKKEIFEQDPTIVKTMKIKLKNGDVIKRQVFITTSRTIVEEKVSAE